MEKNLTYGIIFFERVIDMNYQNEMEKIISNLNNKPSLLLHSCCAPCSSHCILVLADFFEITVFYYNPNIEPFDEYSKRAKEQQQFINMINEEYGYNIKYLDLEYNNQEFKDIAKGKEDCKEGGSRCYLCYQLRLNKTAIVARDKGFDYFTTTLSVSPYKNANWLNEIGFDLQDKVNIKYLPADFKKKEGYKDSIKQSTKYNLYRQDYCGCIYSRKDNEYEE